jgi:hypothetical protein
MLSELNQSHFKNVLEFEYSNETGNSSAWGPHLWIIKYNGEENESYRKGEHLRVFWLKTSKSFEIRHGGGGYFPWWVDSIITNEIALRFDGTISDDGVGEKWKGEEGYCKEFIEYLKKMHRFEDAKTEEEKRRKIAIMQLEQESCVPPAFQVDLGPKIEIQWINK